MKGSQQSYTARYTEDKGWSGRGEGGASILYTMDEGDTIKEGEEGEGKQVNTEVEEGDRIREGIAAEDG